VFHACLLVQRERKRIVFAMKYLALALICVLLCGFQNSHQENVEHPDNAKNQQQSSRPKPSAQPLIPIQSADNDAGHASGQDEQTQDHKVAVVSVPEVRVEQRKNVIDWLTFVCTVVLTIVGIVGTCLALQTLRAIQTEVKVAVKALRHSSKFADAAESSAETAQRHTDALKNIYRAWVLFGWKPGPVSEKFDLFFKNWGQTPAKIEIAAFKEMVLPKDDLGNIPKADVFIITPSILAPSELMLIRSVDAKIAAGREWPDVYSGKKVCVWYGVVQYNDILDPSISHETSFCYWYNPKEIGGLHIGGPTESNKTT